MKALQAIVFEKPIRSFDEKMPSQKLSWKEAERLFKKSGPFYHLNSSALDNNYIFENDGERGLALLFIALSAEETKVSILAYALMSNHFHFIVRGNNSERFFEVFKERMVRYLSRHGRKGLLDVMTVKATPITSLRQLLNEIAYVIRNPYAASSDVNPLGYLWCSGFLYFNQLMDMIPVIKADELSYRELREITRQSNAKLPSWILISGGMVNPKCFMDTTLVENLFMNAQEFLYHTFKNVEAQVEIANRLGESLCLNDNDMWKMVRGYMEREFAKTSYNELSKDEKLLILKHLKYNLKVSNGQIARVLHIPQFEVDSYFPFTAKTILPPP